MRTNSTGVNGNNTHIYAASGLWPSRLNPKVFRRLYFNDIGDKVHNSKSGVFWSWSGALTYLKFAVAAHLLTGSTTQPYKHWEQMQPTFFEVCSSLPAIPKLIFQSHERKRIVCFYDILIITGLCLIFQKSQIVRRCFIFAHLVPLCWIPF